MIPRSVRLIFASCEALQSKGWTYKIEASFLEIYNEQIRDLLGPGNGSHEIRVVNNEIVVTNLKVPLNSIVHFCSGLISYGFLQAEEVTNPNQVKDLLFRAQEQRSVAATNCNERSSRSHSVLRLKLSGVNEATTETSNGNVLSNPAGIFFVLI